MQCELPVSFSVFRSETFASAPSPSAEGAGTIMRFFGVRIAVFFFAVGDSQKQKGLCLLARFFENAAVREAKSTCFQSRKQVRGAVFALGVESYHFPFLILPPIRMTENTATTITAEIHMGESTHIQLHWITPNSFSTIKTIVRTDTMPSPPCFALLSILFLKNLFHNFCKLRWRAVEKNAYTVDFSRQNADTDCRAD